MAKVMLFIDGTWLYRNQRRMAHAYDAARSGSPFARQSFGQEFQIDYGKLSPVLAKRVGEKLHQGTEIDIVRTYLFGSFPAKYALEDEDRAQRQLDFFDLLKEEYHYEVEAFPIDFRGRRLRREDRDPADDFTPEEKCVDIALATRMLYFAAIPYAYDIAIAVIGDRDFKPVLQSVRQLGKRIAIASIKGACTQDFLDPKDEARVKDMPIIWIDDHLAELELRREPHQLPCESPLHKGDRHVWTIYYPRSHERFYCDPCKKEFGAQREAAQREFVNTVPDSLVAESAETGYGESVAGKTLTGTLARKVTDRGFGFIRADAGEFFFHFTRLRGIGFNDLVIGEELVFEVQTLPTAEKAGSAIGVRQHVQSLPAEVANPGGTA